MSYPKPPKSKATAVIISGEQATDIIELLSVLLTVSRNDHSVDEDAPTLAKLMDLITDLAQKTGVNIAEDL
jgi:hypothetical protein